MEPPFISDLIGVSSAASLGSPDKVDVEVGQRVGQVYRKLADAGPGAGVDAVSGELSRTITGMLVAEDRDLALVRALRPAPAEDQQPVKKARNPIADELMSLRNNRATAAGLAGMSAPVVAEGAAVIDGDVMLGEHVAQSGLTVELIGRGGQAIAATTTKPGGLYRLDVDPETLERHALSDRDDLRIRIRDAGGRTVAESTEALRVKPGTAIDSPIAVSRKDLQRRRPDSGKGRR